MIQIRNLHVEIPIANLSPEQDLAYSVLADAVKTFVQTANGQSYRERAMHDQERTWLFSDREDHPFAFVCVCEALRINPDAIRRSLRKVMQKPRAAA